MCILLSVSPSDARTETSIAAELSYTMVIDIGNPFFHVNRMTDKRMKVSLGMAFSMASFSNVKPLYEGFIVKTNGRDWTVNIMMFGETVLALVAGNEPEE